LRRFSLARFYMKRILQHSNEPVTISSLRDHKFIELNDAFLDATGYHRDEVIGRTALELNLWDDPVLHERNRGRPRAIAPR
jgi:PAS domain S-box-containing protein